MVDVFPDSDATYVLALEEHGTALAGRHAYVVYLARLARDLFCTHRIVSTPVAMPRDGALGRRGTDVAAFINAKPVPETYNSSGRLYLTDFSMPRSPVTRERIVFADWNAGWHPWFDGGAVRHFAYRFRWSARDAEMLEPRSYLQARADQVKAKLGRLGLPADRLGGQPDANLPAVLYEYLLDRYGAR